MSAVHGAAPAPTDAAAARHIRINFGLQIAALGLSAVTLASVAITTWLRFGPGSAALRRMLGGLGALYAPPSNDAELAGAIVANVLVGVWALGGVLWIPFNLVGLSRRRAWARASTLFYWMFSLVGCCCIPFGVYGIWSLTRDDVKRQLG